MSPSLPTAAASAALTANEFLNLISLLLGSADSGNAYEDPGASQTGTELSQTASASALYPPVASNSDIAQALIRSMLGGKTTPNTPLADGAKTAQTKAKQAAGAQGVSLGLSPIPTPPPIPAPLPILSPLPISGAPPIDRPLPEKAAMTAGSPQIAPGGVGNQELQGPGESRAQTAATAAAGTSMASAPLAFSARLTPLENGDAGNPLAENAPAEPPVATSNDSKSKAADQDSPSVHSLLRSDTGDAALAVAAAAGTSSSDGFARGFENPAPPNAIPGDIPDAKFASTFDTVADALRTSETSNAASSQTAAVTNNSPVQEITVRIAQPAMPVVDLQVTERAGEIHVAVRTPDASLGTLLRQDLGTLTNSLERAGYRAETYVPGAHEEAPKTAASSQMDFGADGEQSRQGSSGRNPGEPSQGQQQQRQRHHNAQDWNDEMEKQQ